MNQHAGMLLVLWVMGKDVLVQMSLECIPEFHCFWTGLQRKQAAVSNTQKNRKTQAIETFVTRNLKEIS